MRNTVVLSDRKLVLRPWRCADARALARIANDASIAGMLRDVFPHPYTLDDARAFLKHVANAAGPARNFAVELDGELVGGIGLVQFTDVHRGNAEIGYWMSAAHRGRGLASRAVKLLVRWAFASLDVRRIEARIFGWNHASVKLAQRCGFHCESVRRGAVIKGDRVGDELVFVRFHPRHDPARRDRDVYATSASTIALLRSPPDEIQRVSAPRPPALLRRPIERHRPSSTPPSRAPSRARTPR
jgi:RimJ/RimL family protein N-acetyltransferase